MTCTLSPDVTTTDVEDGLVLLDERTGRFWQLNRSGATALRLLLDGATPDEAADRLSHNRPDAAERARNDVERLLASLLKAKLVTRP